MFRKAPVDSKMGFLSITIGNTFIANFFMITALPGIRCNCVTLLEVTYVVQIATLNAR